MCGTFAGLPLQISRTYTDFNALINAGANRDKPEPVEGGIQGYEPEFIMPTSTNDISQDYVDYLENSNIKDHGTVVYQHAYKTHFYYLNGNQLNANPTSNPMPPFSPTGSSYVHQSEFSYEFVTEYFDVVAGSYYNPDANEALLLVDESHRLPNNIIKFFGFNADQVILFEDIVGKYERSGDR